MSVEITPEENTDIEVNGNNAMRGEDNYDEMTKKIESNN